MQLDQIALRRLRVITIPVDAAPSGPAAGLLALADLTGLGYRIANLEDWDDRIVDRWSQVVVPTLLRMRGGDVEYAPLFPDFPHSIPAHKHVAIGDALLVVHPWVPRWFLELLAEQLGADLSKLVRVSSVPQDPKQKRRVVARQAQLAADDHTEWIDLTVAPRDVVEQQLREWMQRLLYAPTSMKDGEIPDVMALLTHFGLDSIDVDRISFLETRALIYKTMWEVNAFDELELAAPRPTDLLRVFAQVTGTDATLMTMVRFPRMTKRQRRLVLSCIDQAPGRVDELYAYRDLWLRIGEYLHPGQYRARYPEAARAFGLLRSERRNRNSLGARCEAHLVAANDHGVHALVELLSDHPTVFARRLRHVVVTSAGEVESVLEQFGAVADQVPTKVLFTLRKHMATVNDEPKRAIINRGGGVRVVPSPVPLPKTVVGQVVDTIDAALARRLGAMTSWSGENVWIDERLADFVAPFQQRKVSDGLLNVARGTRLPLGDQPRLRLFVYWQEPLGHPSDLDLSAITFDRDMNYIGQVSWTRLKGGGITHSGDITSAPVGASEFIDIERQRLGGNVRYVAPLVYRYAGPPFSALVRAHSGWMVRSDDGWEPNSKVFDISTVQNVFDLAGRNAFSLPFVADLRAGEVIYTDLYIGKRQASNQVESSSSTVEEICKAVRHFSSNRVTVHDLAHTNATARGAQIVGTRDRATLTIGLDADCSIRGDDVAAVNAEFLQ